MPDGPFKGLSFAIVNASVLLLPIAFIVKKRGEFNLKETFRTNTKAPAKAYLFALVGTAGLIAAGEAVTSLTYIALPDVARELFDKMYMAMEEPYRKLFYSENKALLPVSLFAAAVMPAFYEEFAFRGFLQKNTEFLMKPMTAIVVASILFTVIHMNPVGSIQIFSLAMLFGYMVYKTDCIWVGFLAHAVNNMFAITVMNLSDNPSLADVADQPVWGLLLRLVIGAFVIAIAVRYFRKLPTREREYFPREKDKSDMFQNYK
jgi:membrane protease YdiL (CAAX protease family)